MHTVTLKSNSAKYSKKNFNVERQNKAIKKWTKWTCDIQKTNIKMANVN